MPNKTIFLNTIHDLESTAGFSFIDQDELASKLQTAWEKDKTQAKADFLAEYRKLFRATLKAWNEHDISASVDALSQDMPNFKQCLLKTNEALKICAMSLIPELRNNEDILSNMTFGVIEAVHLKKEFTDVKRNYVSTRASEKKAAERKKQAYERYKAAWSQTNTRKITEFVRDGVALQAMSQQEKIDYALALSVHRNENGERPLGEQEKQLIDDALADWKKVVGCMADDTLDEFVAGEYFKCAQKLSNGEWLDKQVNEAISEYNKPANPAKQEIVRFRDLEKATAESKLASERAVHTTEIDDETAEMVGDFFAQEQLVQEIDDMSTQKEVQYLQQEVAAINEKYGLRLNDEKMRTSIQQMAYLMMQAREEKERFLSADSIVVIENGKETLYKAEEYFKDVIQQAHDHYNKEVKRLDAERLRLQKENERVLANVDKNAKDLNKETIAALRADAQKTLKVQIEQLDQQLVALQHNRDELLSTARGGIVLEKDGNTVKRHKSAEYYETHETKKEQYAYGEYQKTFSRCYKDACKNSKQQDYEQGKTTDFTVIANDINHVFKAGLYVSNIYSKEENRELVERCNFGGCSAEQLSGIAAETGEDAWALNQSTEEAWSKQKAQAKAIFSQWSKQEKEQPKIKPAERIKQTLTNCASAYKNGEITKKQLLDYMIAADAHVQRNFPTRRARFFSFIQYRKEKNAIEECRTALGMKKEDTLRVAMNGEYVAMAQKMSKEEIFKSVEKTVDNRISFQDEKTAYDIQHQIVQDKIKAEKQKQIDKLKAEDRQPITIPALDERKLIMYQEPRVQPIVNPLQVQQNKNLQQV